MSVELRFAVASLLALATLGSVAGVSIAYFPALVPNRKFWTATDHQVDATDQLALLGLLLPPVLLALLSNFILTSPSSPSIAANALSATSSTPTRSRFSSFLWRGRWQVKLLDKVWGFWSLGEVLMGVLIVLWDLSLWLVPVITKIKLFNLTNRLMADKIASWAAYPAVWNMAASMFFAIRENTVLRHALGAEAGQYHRTIRLHIVFAYIAMAFSSYHALWYFSTPIYDGTFANNMFPWKSIRGYTNMAGFFMILCLWAMAATSQFKMRRKNYRVFYWTHQLYIVFIFFFLIHTNVGWWILLTPTLFFIYDRFRPTFKAERNTTARITQMTDTLFRIDIPIRTSRTLTSTYAPGDYLNINIPTISTFNWHPFSILSYHTDSPNTISLVVKARGSWTKTLGKLISSSSSTTPEKSLGNNENHEFVNVPIKVQGPFGSRSTGYLSARRLVVVAGGAGISSVAARVIHFTRVVSEPCAKVDVVWCVKHMEDLIAYADFVNAIKACDASKVHLHLHVTQGLVKKDSSATLIDGDNAAADVKSNVAVSDKLGTDLVESSDGFLVASKETTSTTVQDITLKYGRKKQIALQGALLAYWFELLLFLLVVLGGAAGFCFARVVEFNYTQDFGASTLAYQYTGADHFVKWYWFAQGPWLMAAAFALILATTTVTIYKLVRRSTDEAEPLHLGALPFLPKTVGTHSPNITITKGRPVYAEYLESAKSGAIESGSGGDSVVVLAAGPERLVRHVQALALKLQLEFHRESFKV